jgi:hypothetical protein
MDAARRAGNADAARARAKTAIADGPVEGDLVHQGHCLGQKVLADGERDGSEGDAEQASGDADDEAFEDGLAEQSERGCATTLKPERAGPSGMH